jgi:hypothetical protein
MIKIEILNVNEDLNDLEMGLFEDTRLTIGSNQHLVHHLVLKPLYP